LVAAEPNCSILPQWPRRRYARVARHRRARRAPGGKKPLALFRYAVDNPRYAKFVLGARPRLPHDRHASRDGPIDFGEVVGLCVTIQHATSREYADLFNHRLLDVDRNAAASASSANGGGVRNSAGHRRPNERIVEAPELTPIPKEGQSDRVSPAFDRLAMLDLAIQLVSMEVALSDERGDETKQEVVRWEDNRVENSHPRFRRRERAISRFRRMKTLQKLASVHANVHNHLDLERHIVDRQISKKRRSVALAEWQTVMGYARRLRDRAASCRELFASD
jgi:hypothetical protein